MDPKEFGQRVYRLRMAKDWTQELCSEKVGISVRTLQMIESYSVSPTIDTAAKLAVAFNCSWNDILGEPSSVTPTPTGTVSFSSLPPTKKNK